MTDLANVWVRGTRLELIRADQIVSLMIGDTRGNAPAEATKIAELRTLSARMGDRKDTVLPLLAVVASGAEPRQVHLRSYGPRVVVAALARLTGALAAATARSEPMLFIHAKLGAGGPNWETAAELPAEWTI